MAKSLPRVRSLDLGRNPITFETKSKFDQFRQQLAQMRYLITLNLSSCNFMDDVSVHGTIGSSINHVRKQLLKAMPRLRALNGSTIEDEQQEFSEDESDTETPQINDETVEKLNADATKAKVPSLQQMIFALQGAMRNPKTAMDHVRELERHIEALELRNFDELEIQ